jgi:hypothetical protein
MELYDCDLDDADIAYVLTEELSNLMDPKICKAYLVGTGFVQIRLDFVHPYHAYIVSATYAQGVLVITRSDDVVAQLNIKKMTCKQCVNCQNSKTKKQACFDPQYNLVLTRVTSNEKLWKMFCIDCMPYPEESHPNAPLFDTTVRKQYTSFELTDEKQNEDMRTCFVTHFKNLLKQNSRYINTECSVLNDRTSILTLHELQYCTYITPI